MTAAQILEATTWNDGENVMYQFHTPVLEADAAALSASLLALSGTGMTHYLAALTTQYPEMLPMAILAATNYTRRNSVQNFMFRQAALTPTVTTTALSIHS